MLGGKPLQRGDLFINKDGEYYRVAGFGKKKYEGDDQPTPLVKLETWDGEKWYDRSEKNPRDWKSYYERECVRLEKSIEDTEAEAVQMMAHPEVMDEQPDNADERALMATGSKDYVLQVKASLDEKRAVVQRLQYVMNRKLARFHGIERRLLDQLRVVHKVIGMIELYLGVHEEIVQIQEGAPAPAREPLSLRQAVLFMDEECGDPRPKRTGQRGIDFQSVEDFDKWLLASPANLRRVLPELKGVVAIRPSRQDRTYSNNPWIDADCKSQNHMVYLLIRNGENLYRIWTGTTMDERFFPAMDELEKLSKSSDYFKRRDAGETEDAYKRNLLLLQGLLDRTEVFLPVEQPIELGRLDAESGLIRFIRDAEPSLTEGRESYEEWRARINSTVRRGSRIFVGPYHRYVHNGENHWTGRFLLNFRNDASCPPLPIPGVYTVEELVHHKSSWNSAGYDYYRILYNPGDEVYDRSWSGRFDSHDRKNRLSFLVSTDDLALNYDQINLADIEFYIESRLERRNYLKVIPVLWGLREQLQEEMAWEAHFVTLVAGRLELPEAKVWEAINWWKYKVLWSRPVRKDDARALRMIERKLRHRTGEENDDEQQDE